MAEEDYTVADSSLVDISVSSANGGKLRKGPRFSWTPAYEATFFRSLCESVQLGLKDNHSFKQEAWDRAAKALQKHHGAYPNKGHLINKSDNARKKFRLWRGLREDPDFLYNPTTRMVTGTEEAWKHHVSKEPLSRSLKGRPFDHEDYMEILFPDVVGSGGAPKRITKRRRETIGVPGSEGADGNANDSLMDLLDDSSYGAVVPPPMLSSTPLGIVPPNMTPQTQSQQPPQQQPPQHHQPQQPPPPMPPQPQQHQHRVQQQQGPQPPPQQQQQQQQQPLMHQQPQQQHGTAVNMLMGASTASTSALTPPDETQPPNNSRKRFVPDPSVFSSDKRRRTTGTPTANFADMTHPAPETQANVGASGRLPVASQSGPTADPSAPNMAGITALAGSAAGPTGLGHGLVEDLLIQLAEAVKLSRPLRWPEQAMEIFFRDFSEEELVLQCSIAEKMLTDPNKALMFCKMTPELRRQWVKRLRDVHTRIPTN
ncbi:hypothetical protein RB594_007079 [Gaeumannomyces avenae]